MVPVRSTEIERGPPLVCLVTLLQRGYDTGVIRWPQGGRRLVGGFVSYNFGVEDRQAPNEYEIVSEAQLRESVLEIFILAASHAYRGSVSHIPGIFEIAADDRPIGQIGWIATIVCV